MTHASHLSEEPAPVDPLNFEGIVDRYYAPLYRFAYSLVPCEASACDLTQQTFFKWACNGDQLRDPTKVKSWLFTTLHRHYLNDHRRRRNHLHLDLEDAGCELPVVQPDVVRRSSVSEVLHAMEQLDDLYRVPLILFHVESHSYKEIAAILDLPIGSVMSRIARGRRKVLNLLENRSGEGAPGAVVPFTDRKAI